MSESQGLDLAPPTPGTEQHGGEARRGLFVRSEVGEGKQVDGNCTLFFKKEILNSWIQTVVGSEDRDGSRGNQGKANVPPALHNNRLAADVS